MKKLTFTAINLLCFFLYVRAQKPAETDKSAPPIWMDEARYEENRLPMHASWYSYSNDSESLAERGFRSSGYIPLDGPWKFQWVAYSGGVPGDFAAPGMDDSHWGDLAVPANWELNGYGLPIYVKNRTGFDSLMKPAPPLVPLNYNPTGLYRKWIQLDAAGKDRQYILHIGAAGSNLAVWVNGKYAGYGEDSKLPSEFDISPYLQPGKNLLTLKLMRWCDGSYLECQDMWRMSGLTRDCYIVSRPLLHIADLQLNAQVREVDHFQSGQLKIAGVLNQQPLSPLKVMVLVEGGGGLPVTRELTITDSLFGLEIPVVKPLLWSAERPHLYTVRVKLLGGDGKVAEIIPQRVGFRKVALRDGLLWVNGRRIGIKGINRHESDPVTGQVVSREAMLRDIRLMKAYHINAVRTAHYPDDEYWYDLCDQYGLYVVDEVNIASPGMANDDSQALFNRPGWKEACLARVSRMYRRDRNHACIIAWGCGHEVGSGVPFKEGCFWLKMQDTTRGILPAEREPVKEETMSGNSMGSFAGYRDTIRAHRANSQDWFLWDFADQALKRQELCKGIFDADRRPKPVAAEIKKAYQDIRTSAVKTPVTREMPGGVTIRVFNDYFFKDLSNIALEWELLVNGVPGSRGRIAPLAIPPQQSRDFRLPVKIPAGAGNEVFLNIRYRLQKQELLLPAGHLLAEEQLLLKEAAAVDLSVTPKGELSFKDEDGAFSINCPVAGIDLRFNKQTGWLQQYLLKGVALLDDTLGLKTNFWRAPTDRDYAAGFPQRLAVWQHSTKEPRLQLFSTSTSSELVIVRADYTLPEAFCNLHVRYTINARGEIQVDEVLEVDTTQPVPGAAVTGPPAGMDSARAPMLPRFGMQWFLPAGYDSIAYYGCGPQENYADRNSGAQIGIYGQTVADQFFPYVRPQETGTKTNVRWWKIMDRQGKGLLITADSALLSMSALHYFDSDLNRGDSGQQPHTGVLTARPQTQLSIDRRQMGVGGTYTGGGPVLPSYGLPYGNYHLTYKISPIPPTP